MKKISTFIICFLCFHFAEARVLSHLSSRITKVDSSGTVLPRGSQYFAANAIKRGDTVLVPVVSDDILLSHQNMVFKRRLDSIQKEIPLNYNQYVQSYIDVYTAPQRKDGMAKVLGLSKYYFPIYEKAFRDAGLPEEIKYLSVLESALDPNAVSRVGATGPWQFMFATAKLYGLNIDNYVDERKDPIQASYAAAAYLRDAYQDFGDWLVAIASYNCGKSNITRAMQKAGATDFWSIRPYLPVETRNYVPAYIAIAYVMNYYNKHNILPHACDISLKTDTVLVNKYVSLNNISKVLKMDIGMLSLLNPQYKKQIINGTAASPKRMVIPQISKENYAQLYDALNNPAITEPNFEPVKAAYNETSVKRVAHVMPSTHTVKHGETLASIADKYGVEVQDLKVWNRLHSLKVSAGDELSLKEPTSADKYETAPKKTAIEYTTYKVRKGDTLSQIAEKFDNLTIEKIKSINNLKGGHLQPGMTLKISRG
jgi:membrane-bound lytic murein transglycosylase D